MLIKSNVPDVSTNYSNHMSLFRPSREVIKKYKIYVIYYMNIIIILVETWYQLLCKIFLNNAIDTS